MTPTTKLGGLPVWAWGLVAIAGIGLGLYLKRRAGNATTFGVPSTVGAASPLAATGGGGTSGTDASSSGQTISALDPYLAQLVGDSNNALVNESAILAGLTGQSVDSVVGLASSTLGQASSLFDSVKAMQPSAPVVYTFASSPASSSTAGTSAPPPAVAASPIPAAQAPAQDTIQDVPSYSDVPAGGSDTTSYVIATPADTGPRVAVTGGFNDVPRPAPVPSKILSGYAAGSNANLH